MSTHSITEFYDCGEYLATMYGHYDGYPSDYGLKLATFLKGFKIVNGLTTKTGKIANGMDCLALQVMCHFKIEPGSFYLAVRDDYEDEYRYQLTTDKRNRIKIRIFAPDQDTPILDWTSPTAFLKFCKEYESRFHIG